MYATNEQVVCQIILGLLDMKHDVTSVESGPPTTIRNHDDALVITEDVKLILTTVEILDMLDEELSRFNMDAGVRTNRSDLRELVHEGSGLQPMHVLHCEENTSARGCNSLL